MKISYSVALFLDSIVLFAEFILFEEYVAFFARIVIYDFVNKETLLLYHIVPSKRLVYLIGADDYTRVCSADVCVQL